MKRLYLAGPMTGVEALNFPLFHAETARLRGLGFEVVNPAEVNPDTSTGWADCMRRDIPELLTCDGVALLPNWMKSKGARLEWSIAHSLGMRIDMASDITEAACTT